MPLFYPWVVSPKTQVEILASGALSVTLFGCRRHRHTPGGKYILEKMGAKLAVMPLQAGDTHGLPAAIRSWNVQGRTLPPSLQKEVTLPTPGFQTSSIHNSKAILRCCYFRPPSVFFIVTAALGHEHAGTGMNDFVLPEWYNYGWNSIPPEDAEVPAPSTCGWDLIWK